jgi:hypothetical protein
MTIQAPALHRALAVLAPPKRFQLMLLLLAGPDRSVSQLARAVRQVIERLGDEDRALVARFARGQVSAAEVDRALWPKLYPALDRFNRAGCKELGGVVRADEVVETSTALGGGKGLHTGVVVACARRPTQQGESRRFLGLRMKHGAEGPTLVLRGFVQEREGVSAAAEDASWDGLVLEIPLRDRASERGALDRAVAAFTGSEADFTWAVPASCTEVSRLRNTEVSRLRARDRAAVARLSR